jgi:hypothetical protein
MSKLEESSDFKDGYNRAIKDAVVKLVELKKHSCTSEELRGIQNSVVLVMGLVSRVQQESAKDQPEEQEQPQP